MNSIQAKCKTAHFSASLSGDGTNRQSPREETDEINSIEAPHSPGTRLQAPRPTRRPNAVVNKEQMCKLWFSDYTFQRQGEPLSEIKVVLEKIIS